MSNTPKTKAIIERDAWEPKGNPALKDLPVKNVKMDDVRSALPKVFKRRTNEK